MSKYSKYIFGLLAVLGIVFFSCKSSEPAVKEEIESTVEEAEATTEEVVEISKPEAPTTDGEAEYGDMAYESAPSASKSAPAPSRSKVKMAEAKTTSAMMSTRRGTSDDRAPASTRPVETEKLDLSAGQLTAAEWNDLYNWDDWKELLNNQDYNEMQEHWTIFPRTRYSVFVRNKYELPLQDISVELLSKTGEVLWSARTDNAGKAELWSDIKSKDKSFEEVDARYIVDGKTHRIQNLKTIEEGVNHIDVDSECRTAANVDIVFAVDATGSMGDEIGYLQSELKDGIERTMKSNTKLNVRLGSVFYRDSTDEYLTRVQPLSAEAAETLKFIDAQGSGGGGDYPEAVDAALDDALSMDWSEEAVARIIFLLLDAPPHHNPEVLAGLQSQVEEAARAGIKIIPITASGINRQTEFLMKFMAIATNGTYVFITDHSGIGNPHLDPVVQDYEVEKLNDLLVRLLYNYTKSNGCSPNDPNISEGIRLSPNPASTYVNVKSDDHIKTIRVLSNTGKLMHIEENVSGKEVKVPLKGLIDGVYTIQCLGDAGESHTEPLVVVSGR